MTRLASALEERGYRWAYRVVNSLSFLPQRRERVFLLASLKEDPADVLFVDEAEPELVSTSLDTHAHGFYWTEGIRGLGWGRDCVPTLKNGSTLGIPSPPAILLPNGEIVTPDIRDAERLQGFRANWTKPAEHVGRASFRWALVGNAVTKPVASWVGKRLQRPARYDRSRDNGFVKGDKWPRAARLDDGKRREVRISDYPTWRSRPPLQEFLRHEPKSVVGACDSRISVANRKKLASVRSRLQRSRPRPSHSRSSGRRVRRQVDARSRMKAVAYQRPTDPARSELMRRVRQRDTKPEQDVAAALRELGLRFRRNVRALPGSPDFANRARHWAVFVHGCFWHRHKNCPRTTTPTRNRRFWLDKFDANRKRDQRNARKLRAIGFSVITVWECQTRDGPRLLQRLARNLGVN